MAIRTRRTEKLDMRLTAAEKLALVTAARVTHRSVTDFVLESALVRADEALASRSRFALNTEQWQKFLEALDAPPRDLPRIERLFHESSIFEPKIP